MTKIIPSILATNENDFKTQIEAVKGLVDMVQIDLADGKFVPNTTWPYQNPEQAQKYLNDIDFELHLMVAEPLETTKSWLNHPRFKRVLVHFESTDNLELIIEEIKKTNKQIGIVLNPDTSVHNAEPYFKTIDSIMLMGVNPGFQGQEFIEETLEKIKEIKEIDKNIFVEIDGGVNEKTIEKIFKAGANAVCPGSAVFKGKSVEENIEKLKEIIKN